MNFSSFIGLLISQNRNIVSENGILDGIDVCLELIDVDGAVQEFGVSVFVESCEILMWEDELEGEYSQGEKVGGMLLERGESIEESVYLLGRREALYLFSFFGSSIILD